MRNPSSSTSPSAKKTTATPCCSKVGIKRGPWTPEEDELLSNYIKKEGAERWRTLPKRAGLLRCGKSCRLRWMNYLRPSVKRGRIAPDEEDLILRLHRLLGNRWSLIAGRIPGRTDNEIKNYWNTHLSKKLISQGIDPRTHKPLNPTPNSSQFAQDLNQNSGPKSVDLEETGRTYRAIATKVSKNFNITNLERYQNPIVVEDGNGNWPNCNGLVMGLQSDQGPSNTEYNYIGNGNEDTFSSFLDSLINENENLFMINQQNQQQPNNMVAPSVQVQVQPIDPSAQTFNNTALWEVEVASSMVAIGDEDVALN
ncbi:hypothetical protein P3X46_034798 [Hevea brasiliensis]|uniref:Uncharacterized protein n=1 Tax=Hevea brasiliensis TaxID=3981 RepID=A0ABQ9KCN2_HEVBR|nr:transcription repressor MYB5 [Hevea brasiliensis]KAJ9131895.1 hypothetical protein P3X46_034798 [Hevea brasiliensis]